MLLRKHNSPAGHQPLLLRRTTRTIFSRPTEHKRVYRFLFNKNSFPYSIVSVDAFVLRQRVLKAHKVLSGKPAVQGGQVSAVPGTGGCIYLVTSHSLVPQHDWL